ncbi:hypothetical protein LA080_014324 [Diaporthe eres]|nr:hypothetical protein LA080_014324 [Diaporthe eres]
MIAFLDETWYNRDIPVGQQPPRGKGFTSRLSRVIGAWELRHRSSYYQTVWHSFKRYLQTLAKPELFVVWVAYLLYFMWSIGINITTGILFGTPRVAGGYGYSPTSVGYLYFAPVVGVMLGEVFGHYFNDWLARRYVKKHGGVYQPEVRLYMIYIAAVCMAVGLIVLGQALHRGLSPAAVVMGWGLHLRHNDHVSGWSNFARAIGGFGVGYFQQPWGAKVGFDVSFGTQAAVVGFGLLDEIPGHICVDSSC